MFTVLLKEWIPFSSFQPGAPQRGDYAETLYQAERVDLHPPGRLIDDIGVVTLEFVRGTEGISIEMTGNRTIYVMNASGKTVARYFGAPPPNLQVTKEFE